MFPNTIWVRTRDLAVNRTIILSRREWVHRGCPASGCSATDAGSATDRLLDAVMLQLRLGQGLDLDSVAASHSAVTADAIRRAVRQHEARGLVVFEKGPRGEKRCRMSDPEGFLLSNDVISDVFAALDVGS